MATPVTPDDYAICAVQQPLPFVLMQGQPAAPPAADEAPARLAELRRVAAAVMGDQAAEAWMAAPTPALGGLAHTARPS